MLQNRDRSFRLFHRLLTSDQVGGQCGGMFHHSLALERRSSKEKLENTQLRQSTLLEANLKLKADNTLPHPDSSPVSTIATLPSEGDLQSVASAKSASLQGVFSETRPKSPSESFRRRQRHTSFADQQQQPLEHMCAPATPRPTLAPAPHPTLAMRSAPPSLTYGRPVQMLRLNPRRAHLRGLLQD